MTKPEAVLAGKHILLVEDNEINQLVAMRLLEEERIQVTCAVNGKDAVETFERSKPQSIDLILMDIRMPVMDGLEATRQIRALNRPDAKTVPIIAMSANAYEEDRQLSLSSGMNAHLSKPVEPKVLYDTVLAYME
ncbi:MAG: response regulator [Lachnospiraceae bacterium]|nr:response regulator [Lachnospiraceae bacterium]